MTIPKFQDLMLPVLDELSDKHTHTISEIIEIIYRKSNLSENEKNFLLPSGKEPIFRNRIRWAKFYLEKAGLVESPQRGYVKITTQGLNALQNGTKIDSEYLERFPKFIEWKNRTKTDREIDGKVENKIETSIDPLELLENSYQTLINELSEELLNEIHKASPTFFERLVIELLLKMGYGGSRKDAGKDVGKTNDEGIDGIIKEDKLGLNNIYIQAKRWKNTIGRPIIHEFVGALNGKGANKGIFITTSSFTKYAIEFAEKIVIPKIVLIDGKRLTELMIEYDVGVSNIVNYKLKKIDLDFFSEE